MKTKLLTMIFLVAAIVAAGQNFVLNGTEWTDSNGDGLADYWQANTGTTSWVEQGRQYSSFPTGTCYLEQPFNIPADGDPYVLEFNMFSYNVDTYVHIVVPDGISFCATMVPANNLVQVYCVFINQNGLYGIRFMTINGGMTWVDNVQLYKYVPVGVEDKQLHTGQGRYYDMLGREIPGPIKGFYVKRSGLNGKVYCSR